MVIDIDPYRVLYDQRRDIDGNWLCKTKTYSWVMKAWSRFDDFKPENMFAYFNLRLHLVNQNTKGKGKGKGKKWSSNQGNQKPKSMRNKTEIKPSLKFSRTSIARW